METLNWQQRTAWQTAVAAGAELAITPTSAGMQLQFALPEGGGYAVARLAVAGAVSKRFRLVWRWQGRGRVETLECKLVSVDGASVWWARRRDLDLADAEGDWIIESADFEFAWGPAGGGRPDELSAIELAFVGSRPASGVLELRDLVLTDLAALEQTRYRLRSPGGDSPLSGLLPLSADGVRLPARSTVVELTLDPPRPCSGVFAQWGTSGAPEHITIRGQSPDGRWDDLVPRRAAGALWSGFQWPSRPLQALELVCERTVPEPAELRQIELFAPEEVASPLDLVQAMAIRRPLGHLPAPLRRQQIDWTVVGAPECPFQALLATDGRVEARVAGFSIEPFLLTEGHWLTWAEAQGEPGWQSGQPPMPCVTRRHGALTLVIETAAIRSEAGGWGILLRYRLARDHDPAAPGPVRGTLVMAVRPYQVSPPWQHWQAIGGLAPLHRLRWNEGCLLAEERVAVMPLVPPDRVHLRTGSGPDWLDGVSPEPPLQAVEDPDGLAEAAVCWHFALAPGDRVERAVFVPFEPRPAERPSAPPTRFVELDGVFEQARQAWQTCLRDWPVCTNPTSLATLWGAARTAAAQILINRDGPALQPGPRRYTRSWIRDGVTMAAALLRSGLNWPVAEFLDWYTPFVAESGYVPCCVDRQGVDPLVEHDSHGQWLHLLAEYVRFSKDHARLLQYREVLIRVVGYLLDVIEPETGLLPPSVSHEGYLARPVHALWDDTWALRGLLDAAELFQQLGEPDWAARSQQAAESLRQAIHVQVDRVMTEQGLETLPASLEWADFDPSATACALGQLGLADLFPAAAVAKTLDRFLHEWRERQDRTRPADHYSAYEIRLAQALAVCGRGEEALELLELAVSAARPPIWQQWPEITWMVPGTPGHLGDLPHTWIAAEFLLAVRSLWLIETPQALVIGRGLRHADDLPDELSCQSWPTAHGRLSLRWQRRIEISSARSANTRAREDEPLTLILDGDVAPPQGILIAALVPAHWQLLQASCAVRPEVDGFRVMAAPATLSWRRRAAVEAGAGQPPDPDRVR